MDLVIYQNDLPAYSDQVRDYGHAVAAMVRDPVTFGFKGNPYEVLLFREPLDDVIAISYEDCA